MQHSIDDRVIEFYESLFRRVFSQPFSERIADRRKRNLVVRQVQESAEAAAQSLNLFLVSQELPDEQVTYILGGLAGLGDLLRVEDIANPNVSPEAIVERLAAALPCPEPVSSAGHDAVYRVALDSVAQVLMLVGPVMAEWQRLSFSSTFELPRMAVNRLNQISEQLGVLGRFEPAAADERYELGYRDYLLQRFHRVEAGTVRMTTNLDVDLRELFVMPRVRPRRLRKNPAAEPVDQELMSLAAARAHFEGGRGGPSDRPGHVGIPALRQVKRASRTVVVGAPGAGKSTFFEWLQVKIAGAEEELVMAGKQAIPLLLRVRQLDARKLPRGAELIEAATASKDRAVLMPDGWIERQMDAGRVLLMLDGLDEVEPDDRDREIIPWLTAIVRAYPRCKYLVSSRPVGYPSGLLRSLRFAESDLVDFSDPMIAEYARHWCTAVRLARNEPEEEARREGAADGDRILAGFEGNLYIRDLARNPLMLSAVCLVNYFEGGQLPDDRAVLYKLCAEGLLHNWDQRRGIRSEFGFEEKLRACREVALGMQVQDRAEVEAIEVREIFAGTLGNEGRAMRLLEHIRYRTGLLLERRPSVFAFAHLTFQEYLAARAIHEGNRLGIDAGRLAREHADGRWNEVIPLYCGLAPARAARELIQLLLAAGDSQALAGVLAEAYLSAGPELALDAELRRRVLERIALVPWRLVRRGDVLLDRFPADEVAPIANTFIGKGVSGKVSSAFRWLQVHEDLTDVPSLMDRLRGWRDLNAVQTSELMCLVHAHGSDAELRRIASNPDCTGRRVRRSRMTRKPSVLRQRLLSLAWGSETCPRGDEGRRASTQHFWRSCACLPSGGSVHRRRSPHATKTCSSVLPFLTRRRGRNLLR